MFYGWDGNVLLQVCESLQICPCQYFAFIVPASKSVLIHCGLPDSLALVCYAKKATWRCSSRTFEPHWGPSFYLPAGRFSEGSSCVQQKQLQQVSCRLCVQGIGKGVLHIQLTLYFFSWYGMFMLVHLGCQLSTYVVSLYRIGGHLFTFQQENTLQNRVGIFKIQIVVFCGFE